MLLLPELGLVFLPALTINQQTNQEEKLLFWQMTNFISYSFTICKHKCEVWKIFWQHGITSAVMAKVTLKLLQIHVIQDIFPLLFLQQEKLCVARSQSLLGRGCSMWFKSLLSHFSVVINGKYCCPKIYFNHRCFSGPYLNKGRIAELPQSVGPGNCVLVLKEVGWLCMLVLQIAVYHKHRTASLLRDGQLINSSW